MLINHQRGSCSLIPGKWVSSGPWHRAYIAREAQNRTLQMPWPFQGHPRLGSGQVMSVQARGQSSTGRRARQGLGDVDTLNQKGQGPPLSQCPDPSSHADRDADTILCRYPAEVKTWGMPGGQLRSVLANANPYMWLPQLLHCLCGQEILGLFKPQQPTLSRLSQCSLPSRTATGSVFHTKNQGSIGNKCVKDKPTPSRILLPKACQGPDHLVYHLVLSVEKPKP